MKHDTSHSLISRAVNFFPFVLSFSAHGSFLCSFVVECGSNAISIGSGHSYNSVVPVHTPLLLKDIKRNQTP